MHGYDRNRVISWNRSWRHWVWLLQGSLGGGARRGYVWNRVLSWNRAQRYWVWLLQGSLGGGGEAWLCLE